MESDADFLSRYWEELNWDPDDTDMGRLFALARRGAAVQWRPISEAPKDTEIIGVHRKDYEGMPPSKYGPWTVKFSRRKWRSSWDDGEVIDNEGYWGTDYKSPNMDPTHFMLLPPPPAGEPSDE